MALDVEFAPDPLRVSYSGILSDVLLSSSGTPQGCVLSTLVIL